MRGRFRSTTLLGTLLSLITLFTLAAATLLLGRLLRTELGDRSESANRLVAASVAHEVSSFVEAQFLGLSLLENREFRSPSAMESVKRAFAAFGSLLITDSDGIVTMATAPANDLGFDLSSRDYFRVPASSGQRYVSPSFIAEWNYTPMAMLAQPLDDGLAIASINLGFLSEFVASLPLSATKFVAVVDARGVFVAHSLDPAQVNRSENVSTEDWFRSRGAGAGGGVAIARDDDGTEELVGWAAVPGAPGWTVIVSEPASRVFHAVNVLGRTMLLVLASFGLLSLLLNATIIRLVRRDISSIVRFSQDLADGRLEASLAFRGFRDFAHLAANLQRMGEAIREREARLRANEQRLFDIIDFLPIPVVLSADDGRIELMNRALTSILGWSREDIGDIQQWWHKVYPDERYRATVQAFWERYISSLAAGIRPEEEFRGRLRCKDGSFRSVIGEAAIISGHFIVTLVDVTEADEAAARVAASLKEKEVLLKEIHHRVKNNLQLVVSLLSLKASTAPETEHLFDDSIDRIRVMAGIHELLYKSRDLSHIDLSDYASTILNWLVPASSVNGRPPRLDLRLERIEVDIDRAIPCGLIINEVITNSLKYAFKDGCEDPTIGLSITRTSDGLVLIRLYDNGSGLPAGLVPEKSDSLGMQLIVSLSSQLGAEWRIESLEGTRWTISFKA